MLPFFGGNQNVWLIIVIVTEIQKNKMRFKVPSTERQYNLILNKLW